MDDKEKQLKDIIFSISLEEWNLHEKGPCPDYSCQYNGTRIILHTSHGSNPNWLTIDGVAFDIEGLSELKYKVEKFIESDTINKNQKKAEEIYSHFGIK